MGCRRVLLLNKTGRAQTFGKVNHAAGSLCSQLHYYGSHDHVLEISFAYRALKQDHHRESRQER